MKYSVHIIIRPVGLHLLLHSIINFGLHTPDLQALYLPLNAWQEAESSSMLCHLDISAGLVLSKILNRGQQSEFHINKLSAPLEVRRIINLKKKPC